MARFRSGLSRPQEYSCKAAWEVQRGRTHTASYRTWVSPPHRVLETSSPIDRWIAGTPRSMAYWMISATVVVMTLYLPQAGSYPE